MGGPKATDAWKRCSWEWKQADMDLAPGGCRSLAGNHTRQSLLDLVDRPQEARGGSVLVSAKANDRFAGFCRMKPP